MLIPSVSVDRALVTNGDWLEFMQDGGYGRADLWLSDGFVAAQAEGWEARATGAGATACGRA